MKYLKPDAKSTSYIHEVTTMSLGKSTMLYTLVHSFIMNKTRYTWIMECIPITEIQPTMAYCFALSGTIGFIILYP